MISDRSHSSYIGSSHHSTTSTSIPSSFVDLSATPSMTPAATSTSTHPSSMVAAPGDTGSRSPERGGANAGRGPDSDSSSSYINRNNSVLIPHQQQLQHRSASSSMIFAGSVAPGGGHHSDDGGASCGGQILGGGQGARPENDQRQNSTQNHDDRDGSNNSRTYDVQDDTLPDVSEVVVRNSPLPQQYGLNHISDYYQSPSSGQSRVGKMRGTEGGVGVDESYSISPITTADVTTSLARHPSSFGDGPAVPKTAGGGDQQHYTLLDVYGGESRYGGLSPSSAASPLPLAPRRTATASLTPPRSIHNNFSHFSPPRTSTDLRHKQRGSSSGEVPHQRVSASRSGNNNHSNPFLSLHRDHMPDSAGFARDCFGEEYESLKTSDLGRSPQAAPSPQTRYRSSSSAATDKNNNVAGLKSSSSLSTSSPSRHQASQNALLRTPGRDAAQKLNYHRGPTTDMDVNNPYTSPSVGIFVTAASPFDAIVSSPQIKKRRGVSSSSSPFRHHGEEGGGGGVSLADGIILSPIGHHASNNNNTKRGTSSSSSPHLREPVYAHPHHGASTPLHQIAKSSKGDNRSSPQYHPPMDFAAAREIDEFSSIASLSVSDFWREPTPSSAATAGATTATSSSSLHEHRSSRGHHDGSQPSYTHNDHTHNKHPINGRSLASSSSPPQHQHSRRRPLESSRSNYNPPFGGLHDDGGLHHRHKHQHRVHYEDEKYVRMGASGERMHKGSSPHYDEYDGPNKMREQHGKYTAPTADHSNPYDHCHRDGSEQRERPQHHHPQRHAPGLGVVDIGAITQAVARQLMAAGVVALGSPVPTPHHSDPSPSQKRSNPATLTRDSATSTTTIVPPSTTDNSSNAEPSRTSVAVPRGDDSPIVVHAHQRVNTSNSPSSPSALNPHHVTTNSSPPPYHVSNPHRNADGHRDIIRAARSHLSHVEDYVASRLVGAGGGSVGGLISSVHHGHLTVDGGEFTKNNSNTADQVQQQRQGIRSHDLQSNTQINKPQNTTPTITTGRLYPSSYKPGTNLPLPFRRIENGGGGAGYRQSWEGDRYYDCGINNLDAVPPFAYYSPTTTSSTSKYDNNIRGGYDDDYDGRLMSPHEAYYRCITNREDGYYGDGLVGSSVGGGAAAMSHLMTTWGDGYGPRIFAAGEVLCGLLAPVAMPSVY